MTLNTKTTLIDETLEALDSGNEERLKDAGRLLTVKCHQNGVSFLKFLFTEVFPLYGGVETAKTDVCPYCGKDDCKGDFGLRTHVSKVHREKFEEFKKQYL